MPYSASVIIITIIIIVVVIVIIIVIIIILTTTIKCGINPNRLSANQVYGIFKKCE